MPPTRRERQHAATADEIKATARRLMAELGSEGISIRAIAREMGMSAPALYHYFASRDNLLTALIVDAFNALADAIEQARRDAAVEPLAGQLMAATLAYRAWALAHPTDFQLIYGNPVPGYDAPREITVPAVARGFRVFIELIAAALASGELVPTAEYRAIPPQLEPHFAALVARDGYGVPPLALYLGVVAWPRLHGIIMLELFNHLQPVVGDSAAFYQIQMANTLREMGLNVNAPTFQRAVAMRTTNTR